MDKVRRALLIGIGQVPEATHMLEPLDEPVEADLRLMSAALQGSGYEVETLHNAGLNLIRSTIYETASSTPADGTLLLYFTGHGLRIGGTDYLIPADAVPPSDGNWRGPYTESLLPANISSLLTDCSAHTVLWFVDACRTNMASADGPFGNSIDNGPPAGGFAVLTGCSAGERSGYTGEGSFFTRGLADALGPLTPAFTVQDVFATARARTRETAARHRHSQTPLIRYGTYAEEKTRGQEICSGRPLLEAWLDAARSTPLWQHIPQEDASRVPDFQDALRVFVEQCARSVHLSQQRLPHPDPWVDDDFPVRLLRDRLPLLLPSDQRLSAIEVALLVAAPFLHEVAWAERLSQATEIDPHDMERHFQAGAHRRHYEQIVEQHGRIAQKVTDSRSRDHVEQAQALTMWLVHRWIADRLQTDDRDVPTGSAASLVRKLGVPDSRVHELTELLHIAASSLGEDSPIDEPHARVQPTVVLPEGRRALRVRPLAALLRLGGLLAVDVRAFPDIIAEHLAVSDPVLPQQIVGIARSLSWHLDGNALHLDALCPHQAVHAALVEVTDAADELVADTVEMASNLRESEAALLSSVPSRVTDRDLRPVRVGSRPSYEVPLLRFHLAQTEVRDLLMGEQLYGGQPELALRELYQNALDACRYREMRCNYLRSTGASPADWNGRIVFTQGHDERGSYVECRDNGVGMSADQLKQTFTRGGSRFERSRAFRREQSRWLRHDPALRLYPNSRFGIGVFSYFMLADEMTIVTRQVSPDGIPAEHALRVEIPSSGSLFRIQRHDGSDDGLAEGGTRVRLYLREVPAKSLSCVTVLQGLVKVSDFVLQAHEDSGRTHTWNPGVLQGLPGSPPDGVLAAVPGALWWVHGEGAILCDGIVTDQTPFGYVVNLTGPHAGKLSVSRNELQGFDTEWIESLWREGAKALMGWSRLSIDWVGLLDQRSNAAARVLHQEWRGTAVALPLGYSLASSRRKVDLARVGWFHLDRSIFERPRNGGYFEHRMMIPWRAAVLEQIMDVRDPELTPPSDLIGHPVPEPGDADIVISRVHSWPRVVKFASERRLTLEEVLRRLRAIRITGHRAAPVNVGTGTLDWIPSHADGALMEALQPEDNGTVMNGTGSQHWGALVLASARLLKPLGELLRQLEPFTALLPVPLPNVPPHHENHICTEADIEGLFFLADSAQVNSWALPGDALEIRELAERTELPAERVIRLRTDFSWLGWTTPPLEEIDRWLDLDDQVYEVMTLFSDRAPDGRRILRWAATIDFADTLEVELHEAEKRLSLIAERLDLEYELRYPLPGAPAHHTPSPDAAELVRKLANAGVHLERGVNLEDLALVSFEDIDDFDLPWAVEDLRLSGVTVPDDISLLLMWEELSLRDRYILSGRDISIEEGNYPAAELNSATLVNAAELLNESLGAVWAMAIEQAKRFKLSVPPLPGSLADLRPSSFITNALTDYPGDYPEYGTASWERLTPAALAQYSRLTAAVDVASAFETLRPLRSIGAAIPDLSTDALTGLRDISADARDIVALGTRHRVTKPHESYVPLDLVSIAGRLGEPLPRTVARIAPYLPLLPAPTALPPVPDIVPLWQDLALLTRAFDGQLPAIAGQVTLAHIRHAADATGESEGWIVDRLRLYATMFGLEIDETGDPGDD
ncbi:HD domain-containing protein [Streptomyces seoulensis]|uniref:HD domain-containing protein n=1 Tax=Streptomyces seoulensis TaxID=73044 RepID=UPI003C30DA2B